MIYRLIHILWYIISLPPMRFLYVLSDLCYPLVYYVVRYRRRIVRKNLVSSFPEKTEKEIRDIERRFYHYFCDYIFETMKLLHTSAKEVQERMKFKGLEQLQQVVDEGQSAAVFLGHYGNWEWIASLPLWMKENATLGQLYHPLEDSYMDHLLISIREKFGAHCIPMHESLRYMMKYQKEGKPLIIGYIADQTLMWENMHLWITFLNHKDTPAFSGSERIIRKLNQAVFYGDVHRLSRGHYECEFKLITREPNSVDEEYGISKEYFRRLEDTIRRDPPYWLWTHNRWKRTREQFDKLCYVKDGKIFKRKNPEL